MNSRWEVSLEGFLSGQKVLSVRNHVLRPTFTQENGVCVLWWVFVYLPRIILFIYIFVWSGLGAKTTWLSFANKTTWLGLGNTNSWLGLHDKNTLSWFGLKMQPFTTLNTCYNNLFERKPSRLKSPMCTWTWQN